MDLKPGHALLLVTLLCFASHVRAETGEKPDLRLLPPVDTEAVEPAATGTADGETDATEVEIVEPDDGSWYGWMMPSAWHLPSVWDNSFELGIDGSEGNSTTLTFRTGANLKRKVDWSDLSIALSYVKSTAEYVETKHNAQLDAHHDWLLSDSPWSIFGKVILVYDEFRPYDLELTLNSGVGYRFIDNDVTTLKGRFGSGATRQFGGPDNQWKPEAMWGVDFEYKISSRQKLRAKVEYFPEWGDFRDYRVRTDAGWEVLLDESTNMSLKLGIIDRYDSNAGGVKPNALDYLLLLLWKI